MYVTRLEFKYQKYKTIDKKELSYAKKKNLCTGSLVSLIMILVATIYGKRKLDRKNENNGEKPYLVLLLVFK